MLHLFICIPHHTFTINTCCIWVNEWVRCTARANRSIRIFSATGHGAAQGPQWVQGKALVGGPGGHAPGFYQIYKLRTESLLPPFHCKTSYLWIGRFQFMI
jgi:hypothetical protein